MFLVSSPEFEILRGCVSVADETVGGKPVGDGCNGVVFSVGATKALTSSLLKYRPYCSVPGVLAS